MSLPEMLEEVLACLREVASAGELAPAQADPLWRAHQQLEALCARFDAPPPSSSPERDLGEELPTVLLVDDDDSSRDAMREVLESAFRVLTAEDAESALLLFSAAQPDVVITDLCMPAGGGTRVLEGIHADQKLNLTPVLVLSGTSTVSEKVRAFDRGAFDFMCKPLGAGELLARAKNALRRGKALRRERHLQETDDLTGLPNRRTLRTVIANKLELARRQQRVLTVAMIDQDGLKPINDRYGHAAGDEAIRTMARALGSCKRATDCTARLGGDEFAVVMPDADRAGAQAFISRVETFLRDHPLQWQGGEIQIRACFGLATLGEAGWEESEELLLERADEALYQAKRRRPGDLKRVS